MVDKDGNKVDIMDDLIRLEGEMTNYSQELTQLREEAKKIEEDRSRLYEMFESIVPQEIKKLRKQRQKDSEKPAMTTLKRPAMLPKKSIRSTELDQSMNESFMNDDSEKQEVYSLLEINCQFKKPLGELRD
jgi:glutamyl-tRNA reductase